jgi:purine-binding chemotaxis protein CheW
MIAETIASSALAEIAPVSLAKPKGESFAPLVSFRLDRQLYALPLDHIERALRMVAITPVPEAPPWIAGVINLHGRVIPMVDLRQRFGQPSREPQADDRLLVVQTPERAVALMVDEVTEVLEVPAQKVDQAFAPLSRARSLAGVIPWEEEMILVLNVAWLLPSEEGVRGWEQEVVGTQAGDSVSKHPDIAETVQIQEDDLTQIKGIGEVYAHKLAVGGVRTFGALAEFTADEIVALLGLSQSRLPDVTRWIAQAAELSEQSEARGHSGQ